jgi:acyl-CoA oxidase
MGHRMAYEAAVARGVDPRLTKLYELSCIKLDLSWYVENGLITRQAFIEAEAQAIQEILPDVEKFAQDLKIDAYSKAPIVSEDKWNIFVSQ